jgi:hypothetical protein
MTNNMTESDKIELINSVLDVLCYEKDDSFF